MNTRSIGLEIEKKVCAFLQKNGLILLTQNYRCVRGEIDLIMRDQEEVVFVEVRSRSNDYFGSAIESVDRRKQQKIIKTASFYLQKQNWFDKYDCRFDIVGVTQNNLEWIKNAFSLREL